MRRGWREAKGA
uniref:Uncharacterized protein n=1 Tax=Arundo donax TaxID=35708 RepID=A0A0A8ZDH1_ARUDO